LKIRSDRTTQIFTGALFLLPALALTTRVGISLLEIAVLAGSVWYARRLWNERGELFQSAGSIVSAFALNFVLAGASLLLTGIDPRFLENPVKAVLVMPVIGLVALGKPKGDWFWYGLCAGTVGAAAIGLYQRFGLAEPRAEGFHMAIMFGDVAMGMGLISLAGMQRFSGTRLSFLPPLTFVAGVAASLLSGTRGGWMALALSLVPLYSYGRHTVGRRVAVIALVGVSLIGASALVPGLGVRQRFTDISTDLAKYRDGNPATSIGLRFENWKGAVKIFAEHPLTGIGRANYEKGLNDLVERKELPPAVSGLRHAHNEILNAFATEGIVGGLALLFLYGAPFAFFLGRLRHDPACRPYALAGLLLVLSYVDFGLTQVMFAHHIGSAFYALTVGALAGLCIQHRQQGG
jgi:O-antigen ligase